MQEIDANKKAWSKLAADHYMHFRELLQRKECLLNEVIVRELGDIRGKSLIHLQCNTGADTISLGRLGAKVTGVDLVPENVYYARKLALECDVRDAVFVESDFMQLKDQMSEKYDIVFTSEGAIGWLPDLRRWADTIRHLLKDDGFFYVMDAHPFYLTLDEELLAQNKLSFKYPYFDKTPDEGSTIGGYATEAKEATSYFWMYTVSEIINSLTAAGLAIEFFNESPLLGWNGGGMEKLANGLFQHPHFQDKLPFTFSLKASVRKR